MNSKVFRIIVSAILLVAIMATCKKDVKVTEVTLSHFFLSLTIGETETLIATVLPEDATNKVVTWKSTDIAVATVTANGLVNALSEGTTKIIVTSSDEGSKVTICTVEVSKYIAGEPKMIAVEGGTFTMGCTQSNASDCWEIERPAHQVTLSSYKIGKYPVTQKEWIIIMGSNPSYFSGDDLPVEQVSWDDAQEFITKLNTITKKKYRLCTEAEWEYAAWGGNKSNGYKYSGSNLITDVGWFLSNSNNTPHPVGSKKPNELGIYDMSGNVWELCSDWFEKYTKDNQIDPQGPSEGSYRVRRGGSWYNNALDCRTTFRTDVTESFRRYNMGFRVAHSISETN